MSEEVTIATADMRRIAELQSQLASAHEQLLLCEADDEALRTVALAYLRESSIQERGRLRVELRKLARAEHPGQALADEVTALRAERQRLLVVAYEAYKLSLHIEEFDTVVDTSELEALDAALLKAFAVDTLINFHAVGERITTALGGYEAMLKARQP